MELAVEEPPLVREEHTAGEAATEIPGEQAVEELATNLGMRSLEEPAKILVELAVEEPPLLGEHISEEAPADEHAVEELAVVFGIEALEEPSIVLVELVLEEPPSNILREQEAIDELASKQPVEDRAEALGVPALEEPARVLGELAVEDPSDTTLGAQSVDEPADFIGQQVEKEAGRGEQPIEELQACGMHALEEAATMLGELAVGEQPEVVPGQSRGGLADAGLGLPPGEEGEPSKISDARTVEDRGRQRAEKVGRGRRYLLRKFRENICKCLGSCWPNFRFFAKV